jgi:hypothetical protein
VANAQTYKWESSGNGLNWTEDVSQTTNTLTVAGQPQAGNYYYRVTVQTSNTCSPEVISASATVTVLPKLSAGEFIVSTGAICVDAVPAAITGNVTDPAGGDGNYSYQWYKGGVLIPGATAATYQPETFSSVTTVVYTRGVKDGSCSTSYTLATGNYTLTVGAAGTQTTNLSPAAQGICGSIFDITAVEPENALGYTWEKSTNGNDWNVVSGQNTNVLDITSGSMTSGVYYYKVTVLSAGTCALVITSTPATVTVYDEFTPGAFNGTTYTETCMYDVPSAITDVTAPGGGSGNFTFQWRKDGISIPGATDATYQPTTNDVVKAGAYTYTREVTDAACKGSEFSAGSFILVVNNAEGVTLTPSTMTVCYGGSFTIEAALVNNTAQATTYTWQRMSGSWTDIPGEISATLTVNPATATTQYRALVGVQGEKCPGISDAETIIVGALFTPGTITTAEKTICISGTPEEITSVADAAGGLGDPIYQWYENGDPVGGNTANYTPAPASTGTFVYTRKVTNASCDIIEAISDGSYTLRVIDAPVVTVDDVNGCAGEAATLIATVTGESIAATYNWQYFNVFDYENVQDGKPANATYTQSGQTLTISGLTTATTYSYRVQMVTGLPGCSTLPVEAQLTISPVPVGGTITVGATEPICATTSTLLTLTGAQGTNIAWYGHDGNGMWAPVSSATTTQIQVTPATAGTWNYMAVVSNIGCSPASSTIGLLPVKSAGKGGHIILTGEPYLCVGQSRTMDLEDSEGNLQWQQSVNGGAFINVVGGATSTAYTSGSNLAAGTYAYRVRALTALCPNTPVYSDTVELRIYAKSQGGAVLASNGASSITMCYDGTADLKVVNYTGEAFQWIYQPVSASTYTDLQGGAADTYTLAGQLGQGTYNIRVIVSSGCAPDTSAAMKVVVTAPVKITLEVEGNSSAKELPDFCKGHELVLKVGGLANASDKWTGVITTGAVPSTYSGSGEYWRVNTANVSAPGTYTYEVAYINEFCAPSAAGPITVGYLNAPEVGTLEPPITEFCYADITPQPLTLSGKGFSTAITHWEWKSMKDHPVVGGWQTYGPAGTASMANVSRPSDPGTYIFRVAAKDDSFGGACTTTYSNEVLVVRYDVPTIDGSSESYTKCETFNANHTFTGSVGATFNWVKTVNGSFDKSDTGDINDVLVYSGSNNTPQTVTYTVTPVVGVKKCEGIPKTITYILYPPYDIVLDEANSIMGVSCHDAKEGRLIFTTSTPATFTLRQNGQPVEPEQMGTAATFTNQGQGLGMGTYTLEVNNGVCSTFKDYVINGPSRPLTIINEQSTPAVCYGSSMGAISFEIDGGTAPYKASINNGAYEDATSPFSFPGLAAGVYSVKVQDAKGCITNKDITVNQNTQLTLDVTAITPVSAAGAHDATATLDARGGSGSYSYSATGLDNDFSPNNVVKGLYEGLNYVYAKDQSGCSVSAPIEIGKYPVDGSTVTISLTATVTQPLTCDAAADAQITVHAFGSSNYTYWKDGRNNGGNLFTGCGAGVHTITVRDNAGHETTIDVIVNPAAPLSFTATITKQLSGVGTNDAEVTLNIIGDPAKFQYSKDGQWGSTNVFSGLSAQTYTFSVRYANATGCEATPIMVGIPEFSSSGTPSVGITASITRALTCGGNTNAEITVTASGGSGTYSFSSDALATTPTWTAKSTATTYSFKLPAGTYYLRVQSEEDHSAIIALVVEQPAAAPVISSVTPMSTTCGNSNGSIDITATGGVGALVYSISGVQWSYSNRIMNLNAGNYNVLAKDSRGCTSAAATVTVDAITSVSFEVTSITRASALTVPDGQVAVMIKSGPSPYNLSLDGASTYPGYTSSNNYTFTDLEAGRYTLTVTDANGCSAAQNVLVGAVEPGGVERISVRYMTVDPTCDDPGQITVMAQGGSGTYTYSLDDRTYGESNVFNGLLAGTYVIYVKDNATPAQKVYVSNVVLKSKEALSFTAVVVQNLSSATAADAIILISAKGGTAPYYQYNVTGSTYTYNGAYGYVSGLPADTYDIVVFDAGGCSVTGKIQITPPVPGETTPRPSVGVSIINEPACFGGNDGAIAVTASGGRAPYAYSVNQVNWTTNNTITGLAAGTYTVYVKELSLDRITEGPTVVLNNPEQLRASAVMTAPVTAPGAADGAVLVKTIGGKKPYQYSIDAQNTHQYDSTFTGLQAQLYTFYVKDGKGCVTTTNITLAEPGEITVSAQITKPISCYGTNGAEVTITAIGGTSPYLYQWDGVSGWNSSATLTGVTAGVHDIFVRDNAGKVASMQVFVRQPMMLAVTAQVTALPTGNNANGAIAITASGGAGNYTYQVDGTSCPVPAVSGLAAGNHTITVTDGNGCPANTSILLASVDVIVNKTVINLQKGHVSETYTVRLASEPAGTVTVGIKDAYNNNFVTITTASSVTPPSVVFTPGNWWEEQEVGVTIAAGVGSPAGGITYFTTKVENYVASAPNDLYYMGITREVIVSITDDGRLNCTKFESDSIPNIVLNGNIVNSPFAICTSDNIQYVLTTDRHVAGYKYRWLKDNVDEKSTTASYELPKTETGRATYTVTVTNATGCSAVSEPFVVNMEIAPAVPVIEGPRVVRTGQDMRYNIKTVESNINYKWIVPSGYSLGTGSFDNYSWITMKIGSTSSILRVLATRDNSTACAGIEGRLDIEVRTSYGVDVFPTVASNGTPLKIMPKNMIVNSIAVINAVGESYAYRRTSGGLPLRSTEEMQIVVNGLSSGHYFIVFYGREQSDDGNYNGRNVVHTEHIVIKN